VREYFTVILLEVQTDMVSWNREELYNEFGEQPLVKVRSEVAGFNLSAPSPVLL
jgi:hypothetical protein